MWKTPQKRGVEAIPKGTVVDVLNKLDKEKFELLDKGYAFDFMLVEKATNDFMHTGIGTGVDMTKLSLINLLNLYQARQENVDIEQFAESVKQGIILFAKENKID